MESVKTVCFHSNNYPVKSGLPPEKDSPVNNMYSMPENAFSCQADARDVYSTVSLRDDDPG
jgi:hypothetical protein